MATGALHSDTINYLILRYLQEHGHEAAAIAFHRDWYRPQEFRDPESLPFAPVVKRNALISVVQDGLLYDELSAKHSAYGRKFPWTAINPREPYSEEDIAALENGNGDVSRPSSSGKRKGRPPAMRAPDEFPTSIAKRQRRSEGSEGMHLTNGDRDAMDVDVLSPDAEADDDVEPASPDAADDTETIEIPERYDSVHQATQTDPRSNRPKATTIYWKVDKPGAKVMHSMWNPDTGLKNASTLLAAGESLCRFLSIPNGTDITDKTIAKIDAVLPPDCTVTAIAWHPLGHTVAYAMDSTRTLLDGREESEQIIMTFSPTHGCADLKHGYEFLLPPPLVICMRFSPNGEYLLVVRTNAKRGLLQVWRMDHTDEKADPPVRSHLNEPVAWRSTAQTVMDACWTGKNSFIVCGEGGLSNAYEIHAAESVGRIADKAEGHGLVELGTGMTGVSDKRWDRVCHDQILDVAVFASTEHDALALIRVPHGKEKPASSGPITYIPTGMVSLLAFQPRSPAEIAAAALEVPRTTEQSCRLAVAPDTGGLDMFRINRPVDDDAPLVHILLSSEKLPEATWALALAWSPDGEYIAVAAPDIVHIWRTEHFEEQEQEWANWDEHLISWHHDRVAYGKLQSNREAAAVELATNEDGTITELLSLSWSADGESLCFGLKDGLAIIRFRPLLQSFKYSYVPNEDDWGVAAQ